MIFRRNNNYPCTIMLALLWVYYSFVDTVLLFLFSKGVIYVMERYVRGEEPHFDFDFPIGSFIRLVLTISIFLWLCYGDGVEIVDINEKKQNICITYRRLLFWKKKITLSFDELSYKYSIIPLDSIKYKIIRIIFPFNEGTILFYKNNMLKIRFQSYSLLGWSPEKLISMIKYFECLNLQKLPNEDEDYL